MIFVFTISSSLLKILTLKAFTHSILTLLINAIVHIISVTAISTEPSFLPYRYLDPVKSSRLRNQDEVVSDDEVGSLNASYPASAVSTKWSFPSRSSLDFVKEFR